MVGKRKEGEGMDNEREWRARGEEEGGKAGKGREGKVQGGGKESAGSNVGRT